MICLPPNQTQRVGTIAITLLLFFVVLSPLHALAAINYPPAPAPGTGAQVIPNTPDDLHTSGNGWNCVTDSQDTVETCAGSAGGLAQCQFSSTIIGDSSVTGEVCTLTLKGKAPYTIDAEGNGALNVNITQNPNGTINNASSSATTNPALAAAANTAAQVGQCLGNGNLIGGIGGCIIAAVAYLIFQIAATILGFVGLIFNWVVTVTVFEFGLYFANSPGMLIAWGILRDIGNIVILFGFILMGIMMILDLESFNVRKALPRLLIFAVLLNFSLFASEAVVDVANGLSAAFYQAAGDAGACTGQAALTTSSCTANGISGTILAKAGLTTIWNAGNSGDAQLKAITGTDGPIILILLALFTAIAAIVLLAGAIMLFIRAITLALLLVVSPLGFAGLAIPPFQKLANTWWKKLISEAFFAPIFLLLIFVALKIADVIQVGGNATFLQAVSGTPLNIGLIFIFLLIFGFMVAALIVAKSFSATGADLAISTSTRVMGTATLGTAGFVGRRTIGAAGSRLSNTITSSKWAQNNPNLARFAYGFTNKAATSSFDARSTKVVQSIAKNKALPLELGKPSKEASHGYHGIEEKAIKDRTEFAKKLKPSEQDKAVGNEIRIELDELLKKQKDALAPLLTEVEDQQKKVAAARARGNREELESARKVLAEKLQAYEKLNDDQTKSEERKTLEKRAKAWDARAEAVKSDAYVEGLHHQFSWTALGQHADHEAAEQIRKGNISDVDKALKTIGDKLKTVDETAEKAEPAHEPAPAAARPASPPPGGGGAPPAGGH